MIVFQQADAIQDKTALVVGGSGFIGRALVRMLYNMGSKVTTIGINPLKDSENSAIRHITVDLLDLVNLKVILNHSNFDYVFNLSGYIDHTPYFKGGRKLIESHFIGLMNLIDCLNKDELKSFIQIGSSDEYGSNPAPQKEYMRESPISPYSLAKAASSHLIQMLHRSEGFPGVVIRLFITYGPGQDENRFLPQIINAFLRGEPVETTEGMQVRDFCYVDDVVEGMIKAALTTEAQGRILNIASGEPATIRKIVKMISRIIEKGKPVFGARRYREGESMELYADISLAKNLIGWVPKTKLEDGIYETIKYYRRGLKDI